MNIILNKNKNEMTAYKKKPENPEGERNNLGVNDISVNTYTR